MTYAIGVGLALAVAVFAAAARFDRERAFYPMMLVMIASYYDLFAVIGGSMQALGAEAVMTAAFVGVAVIGFRRNLWFVVPALLAHGALDLVHGGTSRYSRHASLVADVLSRVRLDRRGGHGVATLQFELRDLVGA